MPKTSGTLNVVDRHLLLALAGIVVSNAVYC